MRRIAVGVGWLLVLIIIWLSLTPSPPRIEINIDQVDKLEHFAAYGSLMFWFAQLYLRNPVRLAYAIGFVAMGIAIEFIQPHFGRDFEVGDMVADGIGVTIGWVGALVVPMRFLGQ